MNDEIIQVDSMEAAKKNSEVVESLSDVSTVMLNKEIKCYWNGKEFEDDSKICDNGILYTCHMGYWIKSDSVC
jgi:hypothetical protein